MPLLAYFLTRHHDQAAPVAATAVATSAFPDLGTVHFATDSADLDDADKATLDKAADAMKDHPDVHMRLEGFTDATGTDPHNMTLSQQRAYSVGNYLKSKGVDGNRLTGDGFGPAAPVDTNAD